MIEIDNGVDENQDIQQRREEKQIKERPDIKSKEKAFQIA